jgi:quaternary ammonium compound-resistance protein SugE
MSSSWVLLIVAGVFEIVWAVGLKLSSGLSRPQFAAVSVVAMMISVGFLAAAMRNIPLGTAYAVWTGIGVLGTFLIGILLAEPANAIQWLSVGLILVGIVGLKAAVN